MEMKTSMATNVTSLTKDWIQFLKNNQIVNLESNPKSGRLSYRRQPTESDLLKFLDVKTDFDQEDVHKAINSILGKKSSKEPIAEPPTAEPTQPVSGELTTPGSDISTWRHTEVTPGEKEPYKSPVEPPEQPKKYTNIGAQDIEFRDTEPAGNKALPPPKRKPRFKYRNKPVTEDFYDRPGKELSEKEIKEIFKLLLVPKEEPEPETPAGPSPEEVTAKKQEDLRKVKRLIRDTMTDNQRKALWRLLTDNELTEAEMNRADVKSILTGASDLRNKPSGLGKIFKGLRKDKIDVNDLQKAWKEEGFPDDTEDIKNILLGHGFSEKEINKVFGDVFGKNKDDEYEEPVASPTIRKIADYAKKNGIEDELKAFMQKEFGEQLGITQPQKKGWFGKKAVVEDIRQIFTEIVHEERLSRAELIKRQEKTQLGRTRK
jgi:hypothetical protein